MTTERTYIGNGRQKHGSEYITLNICFEDLVHAMEHALSAYPNGNTRIRAVLARKRTPTADATHVLYIPHRPDAAEREALRQGAVADRQEQEVRAWDRDNS